MFVDQLNNKESESRFVSELRYNYLVLNYPQAMDKLVKKPEEFVKLTCSFIPKYYVQAVFVSV